MGATAEEETSNILLRQNEQQSTNQSRQARASLPPRAGRAGGIDLRYDPVQSRVGGGEKRAPSLRGGGRASVEGGGLG